MIYVYSAVLLLVIILAVCSHGYKKGIFTDTDTREDPLKFLYPTSARILDFLRKYLSIATNVRILIILKQLHVSENAAKESYLFRVKRISVLLLFITLTCMLGILLCIYSSGNGAVTSLERNDYGDGSRSYSLEAEYDGREELVELEVPERKMTDEEIYGLFEASREAIGQAALADNESWENVSSPLNLITEYGKIRISWETDDDDLISYSGELTDELEPGESILINLKAAFKLGDVTEIYMFPAMLTAPTLTEAEALIGAIRKSLDEGGSEYDPEVELPEEIDGKEIRFRKPQGSSRIVVPVLVLAAGAVAFFGYERKLSEKLKERREQMMSDFAEIVFKLSLLYEAGMSIRGAWERIIADSESAGLMATHYAFQEMKLTSEKIKSGISEAAAYGEFGRRCALHRYIKLGNILQQNLMRGTKGMKDLLAQEARDAFEDRKRLAKKKGEEAGTKMLIPMVMKLIGCPILKIVQ